MGNDLCSGYFSLLLIVSVKEHLKIRYNSFLLAGLLTFLWGGIWLLWEAYYVTPAKHYERIEQAVHEELEWSVDLLHELKAQLTLAQDPHSGVRLPARYPIYVYNQGSLVYWSEHQLVPSIHDLQQGDSVFLYEEGESQYLVVRDRFILRQQSLLTAVLIPLRGDFQVNNAYLQPSVNDRIFASTEVTLGPPEATGVLIEGPSGLPYFTANLENGYLEEGLPGHWVLLYLGTLVLFSWGGALGRCAWRLGKAGNLGKGLLVLVLGWGGLRAIMLVSQLPNTLVPTPLFEPLIFYSSAWNPSLGDLLLNLLVGVVWSLYVFNFYPKWMLQRRQWVLSRRNSFITAVVLQLLAISVLTILVMLVESLYHNSSVFSLDTYSSFEFSWSRWVSIAGLVQAALIYFLISHVSLRISLKLTEGNLVFFILTSFLIGSLPLFLLPHPLPLRLLLSVSHWVYIILLFRLRLTDTLSQVRYSTFLYFFVNLIISAFVMAYGIYFYEMERLIQQKQQFAEGLEIENDFLGEYLLDEAGNKIAEDRYIASHFSNPLLPKNSVVEKIRKVHMPDHFESYDVNVYLFDQEGEAWYNTPQGLNFRSLRDNYAVQSYATEFPDLYFIQELDANLSERYLRLIEIKREGFLVGYVVLDLRLKKLQPNSVYPQLFGKQTVVQPKLPEESSYAIFQEGGMVFHTGSFNYYQDLDLEKNLEAFIQPDGMLLQGIHHWGEEQRGGRLIVISTPVRPFSRIVANFSFLYLIFVSITLLSIAVYAVRFALRGEQINYATKIQLYLNLSFFLPLLVVSVTTVSIITSAYQEEVTEAYFYRANSIATNLGEELTRYVKNPNEKSELAATLSLLAKHTESDLHLYNTRGELITSSQIRMQENGFLSDYINPYALAEIRELQNTQTILDEAIGELDYKAVYLGISSYQSGQLIGVLSIPFFDARQELGKEVGLVLTSVMNIFTVLFLLFLVASYFLSGVLTFPLRLITQKIKRTTLSERNEPLEWNTHDEIGLMVGEYNRMVVNLEASKEALARSEKESAWREMAKQVAHEIKNPLTPMKLTLQHMRRKLGDQEQRQGGNLFAPIDSLLKQVDTLSDIATSFSSFAKMPVPKHEVFDLEEVIGVQVTLHSKDGNVGSEISPGAYRVLGDEKLMGRIISNLIINGIQSVPAEREPMISVRLSQPNGNVLAEVQDNGTGIAEEIQNKVFVPNFSTKYTGSGIGLAIAKRGIEHAGGRIWFETEQGKGTTFFIELPRLEG
ncbi:MAG TPA: hypothetical protein DCE41_14565 [Cytophagales bacterium]|nr:hypothetical protein [Cytophagales bacterium]HAA17885.1 hypothetical protein [Cytophagales bacterium]